MTENIQFSLKLVIENIVSMSASFSLEMISWHERWLTTSECARHMWSTHKESVLREMDIESFRRFCG